MTVRPAPGLLAISMEPRSASTLRRTTSMPTPRPDTSVISRAVENPGARISEKISDSESCAPLSIKPCSMARARTASARPDLFRRR